MKEKKSLLEVLITPIVIAIVGLMGTYLITNMQVRSSENLRQTQLLSVERQTKSEHQIKIVEIFSEKITSKNLEERELAVRILATLDSELSENLMIAISQTLSIDTLTRSIASEMINANSFVVIGSFYKIEDAIKYIKSIENKDVKYPVKIFQNESGVYAACLNGNMTFEMANVVITYAKEYLTKDAYIRKSKLWTEILMK